MEDVFNTSNLFRSPGDAFRPVPFAPVRERGSDVPVPYYQGVSRLFALSQQYYGSPDYEQLILLANPEWLSEHDIPDGTMLRVPFPLEDALHELATAQGTWLRNAAR
jgi:hypothetical protein